MGFDEFLREIAPLLGLQWCANGEEPYSLSMLWKEKFESIYSGVHLAILATDLSGRKNLSEV